MKPEYSKQRHISLDKTPKMGGMYRTLNIISSDEACLGLSKGHFRVCNILKATHCTQQFEEVPNPDLPYLSYSKIERLLLLQEIQ